ncbi:MAG TPA: cytochrome o ubiquinol oxidase subunit IV [Nevskiaceae bacterium]|nr:cytochrome o ubiquinol oxidase subunit IV [Nevskiaceae bacterium]
MTAATDTHGHDEADAHGSLKGYLTGFILAAILTAIPFWLVMGHIIHSEAITILLILILGIAQIFVHLVYFLHMNAKAEEGWNLMSLAFTLMLVVIVIAGSIWVMYWLNTNMMVGPMAMH